MLIQPVILSGGSGTRLWPLSREKYPKQLLSLVGDETMLQATACRMKGFTGSLPVAPNPIVVSNEEYRFITAEQLRAAGVSIPTLLLEPVGRNTAPALTLAALAAQTTDADPVLLVMPADHVIRDRAAFHLAIDAGLPLATEGAMVTFGIVPDRPETGYGYIQMGAALPHTEVRKISGFVEKPDHDTAKQYLAGGNHLWNSGIFMMRASVWLRAINHFNPKIASTCKAAFENAQRDSDFVRVDKDTFASCPADSIDYAVMEKLPDSTELGIPACIVPLGAGWSDIGAWDALWQVSDKDESGNATQGDVLLEDSSDCLVIADSRLVTCLGLDGVVVVETPDAILVARKSKTQQIKKIVSRLKSEARSHTDNHRKVYRPWGHYDSIDCGERFQVKRIVVKPGASLSLQMHHHRAEHWIVVRGTARITKGEETITLSENQSTYIPLGTMHRLENPGRIDLELIEVQSGSYLGEDDIVRFKDDYGRHQDEAI
ncbi:MAG: mannose-1-phosphate guanylyltransferase/mannose-6-phosphate isomerase [Burkholderiales bacterium]